MINRGLNMLIWIQLQVKAVLREMLVKVGMVWCVLGTAAGNSCYWGCCLFLFLFLFLFFVVVVAAVAAETN